MMCRNSVIVSLPVIFSIVFASTSSPAVDWDGGGDGSTWGATPGAANSNWSANLVPTDADDVVINDASVNGGSIDFDGAEFRNLTIGGAVNNMGSGLTLAFDVQGDHFAAGAGELRVIAGTGAVSILNTGNREFRIGDGSIFVEEGVTGDFILGTPSTRFHLGDNNGGNNNGPVRPNFTNNSDQDFIIRPRHSNDRIELTLHSSVNGTPGSFILEGHSIAGGDVTILNVTGDALFDMQRNVTNPLLSTATGTEITNTSGTTRTLGANTSADSTVAGKITGNLNFSIAVGNENAITLLNDDTYTGTTTLGGGTSNTNRAMALIREGTHVGGDDYTVVGGMRNTADRRQNAVLGGSGTIELRDGSTVTLDRTGAAGFRARATLAPGNVGWDHPGVDANTGATGLMALGNQGIGTLTVSADEVIFGDYSRLEVQVSGPNSDLLNILGGNANAGSLDLSSALDELFIDADLLGDADGSTYTLLSWEGTRTGTFDSVLLQDGGSLLDITANAGTGFQIDGFDYTLDYGDNALQLVGPLPAVPEPVSIAIWILLGLSALGYAARKK